MLTSEVLIKNVTLHQQRGNRLIKSRVISITTDVIDHGYSGLIKKDMIDDIIGSFVVCMVNRKLLSFVKSRKVSKLMA